MIKNCNVNNWYIEDVVRLLVCSWCRNMIQWNASACVINLNTFPLALEASNMEALWIGIISQEIIMELVQVY